MKKKLMVILAVVSMIGIAVPAMAGDWVAALEQELLETQNVTQALINAEKAGGEKEEILLAAASIIENNQLHILNIKDFCSFFCCPASDWCPGCECPTEYYDTCVHFKVCPEK